MESQIISCRMAAILIFELTFLRKRDELVSVVLAFSVYKFCQDLYYEERRIYVFMESSFSLPLHFTCKTWSLRGKEWSNFPLRPICIMFRRAELMT
jgi:hypothetical protein